MTTEFAERWWGFAADVAHIVESIPLRKMLGSPLKTLRTRAALPPPNPVPICNEQCAMSNVPSDGTDAPA